MGGMASLAAQRTAASQLYNAVILVDITPHFDLEGARRIISFMSGNPDGFTDLDEAADAIAAYNPHRPRPADSSGLTRVSAANAPMGAGCGGGILLMSRRSLGLTLTTRATWPLIWNERAGS